MKKTLLLGFALILLVATMAQAQAGGNFYVPVNAPYYTTPNQGTFRFYEAKANGSNYFWIKSGASLASNIGFVLPSAAFTGTICATNAAGTMTLGACTPGSGSIGVTDIDATATIGANPTWAANSVWFGTTGLIFEGATGGAGNANELLLTAADPGGDVTVTIPAETGTIVTTASTNVATGMITDATIAQVDINDLQTIGADPANGDSSVWFGTTGLIFEGATSDGFEGLLTSADIAASDKTWTLPNVTGTLITSGDTGSVTVAMLDHTDTIGADPAWAGQYTGFGTTGIIYEGTADTIETLLTFADPTAADKTVTIPNETGTVITTGTGTTTYNWINTPQAITIADDSAGTHAAQTVTPTSSVVLITCNDGDGCTCTMDETGAVSGQIVRIVEMTGHCDFADSAGVSETTGGIALGQYDSLSFIYATDRWVELEASDN